MKARTIWIVGFTLVFLATIVASWIDDPGRNPVFYAAFAFVACLVLLFLTKVVGKKVLMRKENYYDSP